MGGEGQLCSASPSVRFGIANMHDLSRLVIGYPSRCSNGVSQQLVFVGLGLEISRGCLACSELRNKAMLRGWRGLGGLRRYGVK